MNDYHMRGDVEGVKDQSFHKQFPFGGITLMMGRCDEISLQPVWLSYRMQRAARQNILPLDAFMASKDTWI